MGLNLEIFTYIILDLIKQDVPDSVYMCVVIKGLLSDQRKIELLISLFLY